MGMDICDIKIPCICPLMLVWYFFWCGIPKQMLFQHMIHDCRVHKKSESIGFSSEPDYGAWTVSSELKTFWGFHERTSSQVFRADFWMMHFGAECPKRTTVCSSDGGIIWKLVPASFILAKYYFYACMWCTALTHFSCRRVSNCTSTSWSQSKTYQNQQRLRLEGIHMIFLKPLPKVFLQMGS